MPAPPAPPRPSALELALGLALPSALLVAPAAFLGLGDPYELNAADVARRAALHLFDAPGLALAGAENRLPTLGDVGRGELPTLAVALAQRLAGLGLFSARAPLALAGVAGLGALWLWARRVAGPRAAAHGAWALATMPLYAAQSRGAAGEAMAMAALVASFAGLSVLFFDERVEGARAFGWALLALAGLVVGFACRGAVFGLAVPLLSTGAAAFLTRGLSPDTRGPSPAARARRALAVAALAGGAVALGASAYALAHATPSRFSYALGAAVFEGLRYPTFDQTLRPIGHGLFPWSVLLPAAFVFIASPPARVSGEGDGLNTRVRIALVLGACASYAAHAWLAPKTGPLPFIGVGLLAATLALAFDELGRRRGPLRMAALATAALVVLLAFDFARLPDATLDALLLPGAALPDGFASRAASLWALSAALSAPPLLLALVPVWSVRSPVGARLVRFVRRDRLAFAGLVVAAFVPCLLLYPELAERWSPRGAIASYRRLRLEGEPLGLWGVASRSPAHFGEPGARAFVDAPSALAWLDETEAPSRRWLLVRAAELPELNALWRARQSGTVKDRNLPLLDASSGHVSLAASFLREGEHNATPLARAVGDELPRPAHPLEAQFGDELEVLGWDLYESDDRTPAEAITRGRSYVLQAYYRVLSTPSLPWRALVHLEGGAQRYTADHELGAYPITLWQAGDIITDRTALRLEPNFAPGVHPLFVGFYLGDGRLPVTRGRHDDDRVEAGALRVR